MLMEWGNHTRFPVTYSKGSAPDREGEAAISYLLSEELGLNPGDTFEVKKAGKYEKCRVASYCKRILYMLDGKIWGELSLEGQTNQTQEQREEKVRQWLEKMGW